MRWLTPFGMLFISGTYYGLIFFGLIMEVVHNALISLVLAFFVIFIWDLILSIIYGLKFVKEGEYLYLEWDGQFPDPYGLFASTCLSAVIWTYADSLLLGLIVPVIVVFLGKQLMRGLYKKLTN